MARCDKLTRKSDGSWTETVLHSFNGRDGGIPVAGMIFDATGNLYGTATVGGASGHGVCLQVGTGLGRKLDRKHAP